MNKFFILSFSLLLLSACGTMEVGSFQKITFSSNVPDVGIYDADRKAVCTTPCSYEVRRKTQILYFIAKKEGYQSRVFEISPDFEGSFFKHYLTSGVTLLGSPAITTDLATGAAFEYEPGHVYINMIRTGSAEEMEQQREEAEIRRYFMSNYQDIMGEIATGEGEKLDTLKKMTLTQYNEVAYIIEQNPGKEKASIELIRLYQRNKAIMPSENKAE